MTLKRVPFSSSWEDEAGRTYLEYHFPLGDREELCTLILPRDLRLADVQRMARFLETLAVDSAPARSMVILGGKRADGVPNA